jgi:hypothetical protein
MKTALYTYLPNSLKECLRAADDLILALPRTEHSFLQAVYRCELRHEQLGFQPAVHFQDGVHLPPI